MSWNKDGMFKMQTKNGQNILETGDISSKNKKSPKIALKLTEFFAQSQTPENTNEPQKPKILVPKLTPKTSKPSIVNKYKKSHSPQRRNALGGVGGRAVAGLKEVWEKPVNRS